MIAVKHQEILINIKQLHQLQPYNIVVFAKRHPQAPTPACQCHTMKVLLPIIVHVTSLKNWVEPGDELEATAVHSIIIHIINNIHSIIQTEGARLSFSSIKLG
jgi:hypothetical protein